MSRAALASLLLGAGAAGAGPFALFNDRDAGEPDEKAAAQREYEKMNTTPVTLVELDREREDADARHQRDADAFRYLNGLGADEQRTWEIMSETAFGTRNVFTQRLEVALGVMPAGMKTIRVVARVGVGFDAHTAGGYAIQGFAAGLGVRHIASDGRFLLELGARVIPGLGQLSQDLPSAQTLALGATLTSMAADDTRWAPISAPGAQFYVEFQSRTRMLELADQTKLSFGAHYGGQGSLAPIPVHTWLGPEPQLLANIFVDLFLAIANVRQWTLNLVVGFRGIVSLSSIWPAELPLPVVADFFLQWTPRLAPWLTFMPFFGWSGSANAPSQFRNNFGVRFQFFLPDPGEKKP